MVSRYFKKIALIVAFVCLINLTSGCVPFLQGIDSIFEEFSSSDSWHITDVQLYNSEEYPLGETFFPQSIPQNATVVSFVHYKYYSDRDIYLELRFDTQEELLQHVAERKEYWEQQNALSRYSSAWIELSNIYDSSYIDAFSTQHWVSTGGVVYTGYERSGAIRLSCQFAVISYSVEDLTVVYEEANGYFPDYSRNYVPQYFVRFSIPYQDVNHQRIIVIENRMNTTTSE